MNGEPTLSEIGRAIQRIEKALEPLIALPTKVENAEQDIRDLSVRVDQAQTKATYISGAISGIGFIVSMLFGRR